MYRKLWSVLFVIVIALAVLIVVQPGRWSQAARSVPSNLSALQPSSNASVATLPYTTAVEIWYGNQADGVDPALDYETGGGHIIQQVYETLITYKREKPNEFVPLLASGWTVSPDGKTYTFTLRPGIRFHNGATLTAEDVAFTFQRGILTGNGQNTPQWLLSEPLFNVDDVTQLIDPSGGLIANRTALQAQPPAVLQATCMTVTQAIQFDNAAGTVTFHLARPWNLFLDTLAGSWGVAMDKDWLIANGTWNGNCNTWQDYYSTSISGSPLRYIANGTGPFMLDHWTVDTEIGLKRNPDYWLSTSLWPGGPYGPAKIETVLIKIFLDGSDPTCDMFSAGTTDFGYISAACGVTLSDQVLLNYDQLSLVGTLRYLTGTLKRYSGVLNTGATDVLFNYDIDTNGARNYIGSGTLDGQGIPPDFFNDLHVRKAFNYTFNWTQYLNDVWGGQALQRRGPIIKGILGYTDTQPMYFYSPTLALQEFGLAWGGQVLSHGFVMTLTYNTGNSNRQRVAEILKADIEALNPNFHINVQALSLTDYNSDQYNSRLPILPVSWGQDIPHPHNWIVPYFEGVYANRQRLPADQRAIYQAKADACLASSGTAAQACYEDIQNTAYLSATDIFLAQGFAPQFVRAEVQDYYINTALAGPLFYVVSKGPLPTVNTATPGIDQSIPFTSTTGATAGLNIPGGAITQSMSIVIESDLPAYDPPVGFSLGNLAFDLKAYVSNTLISQLAFSSPVTLTLHYNAQAKGAFFEDRLRLFWWNSSAWEDAACRPYTRDLVNHVLQVPICHFSKFAIGGISPHVFLPLIRR